MIVTTCDEIPGKSIIKTLGLVKGNTVRARHVGVDIMALLRNVVGGEVTGYTKMLAEAREQSLDRMIAEAEAMGANAVVTLRFTANSIMSTTAELLAYGTAVVIKDAK